MKTWDTIFDNHMHLRNDGYFLEAARIFQRAGGTAFNLVNLPDYSLPMKGYYENIYEKTLSLADRVRNETGIEVIVTIGPYPLDYLHFSESTDDPAGLLKAGIDLALDIIREGRASALGEIGRPHFDVSRQAMQDFNEILIYGIQGAADSDIPVVLHTEDLTGESYEELCEIGRNAGLKKEKLIKHHAYPDDFSKDSCLTKSILATRPNVRSAIATGKDFFLETDYVDDREKPGKVIPADSVPKRAEMIQNEYPNWEEIFQRIFKELPSKVFEVEFEH